MMNTCELQPGQTLASTNYPAAELGREVIFADLDYSTTNLKTKNSGRLLRARIVKNDSGGALLPKRCVKYTTDNGEPGRHAGAMTSAGDRPDGVVDPWLPAAGVANGDIFLLFFEGPIIIESDGSAAISIGDRLVTAGTATGKVKPADSTPASDAAMYAIFDSDVGIAEDADAGPTDGADIVTRIRMNG